MQAIAGGNPCSVPCKEQGSACQTCGRYKVRLCGVVAVCSILCRDSVHMSSATAAPYCSNACQKPSILLTTAVDHCCLACRSTSTASARRSRTTTMTRRSTAEPPLCHCEQPGVAVGAANPVARQPDGHQTAQPMPHQRLLRPLPAGLHRAPPELSASPAPGSPVVCLLLQGHIS